MSFRAARTMVDSGKPGVPVGRTSSNDDDVRRLEEELAVAQKVG